MDTDSGAEGRAPVVGADVAPRLREDAGVVFALAAVAMEA